MNPIPEIHPAPARTGRIARLRFEAVLLSCLLAVGGVGRAVAQTPEEPPAEVPVVVEAVAATATPAAAGAEAEPAAGPEDAQAPDDDAGSGDVPADAQAAAAGVLAGGTNAPSGSTNSRSGPSSARREGRSRERGTRDWRSSFGSASRSKSGGTNSAPEIPKTDYAYFKVVNDRNIFNPGRQPNRPDRSASREVKRTPKVDAFSLVGTLRYEKGDMAFFDGSSSDYRKAHKAGDTIAGYKVLSISDSAVRIEAQGKVTQLKIGSQMRREDDGEWTFAEGPYAGGIAGSGGSTSSGSGGASTASASTGSSSGGGGGSADEILKRLLQKREQEMKNEK